MSNSQLEAFTYAYITCALWASNDDDGEPLDANYDVDDLDAATLAKMKADCAKFYSENETAIQCDSAPMANDDPTASESERKAAMAGHYFWLNRNGHGSGFWDGDYPEPQATILDRAARSFNQFDLYVGDDGKLYA